MRPLTDRISHILSPLDPAVFFERYWGKAHLHVSRNLSGYYDGILHVNDLDTLLQSEQLPAAFFEVYRRNSTHYPDEWSRIAVAKTGEQRVAIPERIFDLYAKGATVILNQAHHAIPALSLACREITCELGFTARANVYLAPPDTEGFPKHADAHEVLILQVSGTKSWLIYPQDRDPVEINVCPGDLLYLPRNTAHAARTQKDASIHVTLGLQPSYAFQLIEELAALAEEHAGFQQPVPPDFAGLEARRLFEAEFAGRLRDLIAETLPAELIERRFRALVETQSKGWPGRFSDLSRLQEITRDTVVCARSGIVHWVEDDGKVLNLRFAGSQVVLPRFLKACLDRILGDTPFAIRDLPGMVSDPGKVELVRKFVKSGFLAIVKI